MTGTLPTRRRQTALYMGIVAVVLLLGCKEEELQYTRPPFGVVVGEPVVGGGSSTVVFDPPEADPAIFSYSASVRVDVFRQNVIRKVDILWVVDNSPSMTAVQDNLARNFASFITELAYAEPPVDYHIGVITPDSESEKGVLRRISGFTDFRYIACNSTDFVDECNVGSLFQAEEAFKRTVTVGADGQPVEKGLLAMHMALTEPAISLENAGFIRDDAALYVIAVSDEGDASCYPLLESPPSGDYRECTFYPDCRCADDDLLKEGFGSVDFFVRFLQGFKGYGQDDMVKFGAIVGDDQEDLALSIQVPGGQIEEFVFRGCRNPQIGTHGMHGIYAPRYIEVADRTGGVTVSICDDDYSEALAEIGFGVSGQRRDFQLSRAPVSPDLEPFRVTIIGEEEGRRIRTDVRHIDHSPDGGWSYIRCEGAIALNSIRFHGSSVPPPNSIIEVAYKVDVSGIDDCI